MSEWTIREYSLWLEGDAQKVMMPRGACILSVTKRSGEFGYWDSVAMWALVDETEPPEARTILVVATGARLVTDYRSHKFIGSVDIGYGPQGVSGTWHVFEATDE